MNKKLLASLLLIPTLLLGACTDSGKTGKETEKEPEDKKVVYQVGIDTTFPPFEYEKDGKYEGIDVDIINAIAEDQGFEVKLNPMDFKGIVPGVQTGQLHIGMGGMSITDERKKVVDFSDSYFEAGITLVVKKDNETVTTLDDLKGQKVAVKKGTVSAAYAESVAKEKGFELVLFDDSPAMFLEVSNGNAIALLEDYPVITYAIAQSDLGLKVVGERLTGDNYGISVLKGKNDELLKKINDGLANLKETGKYQEILNKYLSE